MTALLEVRGLTVEIPIEGKLTPVVQNVSLDIEPGETLGLVGESGSGKSLTALSILRLVEIPGASIKVDRMFFDGQDLMALPERRMRDIRGKDMAVVFQDPLSALNPVLRVDDQIAEAIKTHDRRISRAALDQRVLELLRLVGIPDPENRRKAYPGQFSGGMRQRVMTAIAVANHPKLLILDEPTTALDVTIQAQVLRMLENIRDEFGCAALYISHDLGVVAGIADKVAVMYAGKIVETSPASTLFRRQDHHYTRALFEARPSLRHRDERLTEIPGRHPPPAAVPSGCSFHPRCPRGAGEEICRAVIPQHIAAGPDRTVACHFPITGEPESAASEKVGEVPVEIDLGQAAVEEAIVSTRDLEKTFQVGKHVKVRAVDKIDLDIFEGQTLALIGESGCGKSTAARVIALYTSPTNGALIYQGSELGDVKADQARAYRRDVQMVHQDPASSFDPRQRIGNALEEIMRANGLYAGNRHEKAAELITAVGLDMNSLFKRPYEFSGGQRQRVALARALAVQPSVLVLDEPVSALDVSVQAQIINLLFDLQQDTGLSYVFIAHDLAVARHVANHVAVMYLGRIVEHGPSEEVFTRPVHPYTRALLSAAPSKELDEYTDRIELQGEIPSAADPPSGCHFRTRCWLATERCTDEIPLLLEIDGTSRHRVACHYSEESERERVTGAVALSAD